VHELGLCEAVVNAVERRAGDRPVARVKVRVGLLHHVHPEATAELVLLPIRGRCGGCGAEFECEDVVMVCPECHGFDVETCGGDELILEAVEYRP